MLVCFTFLAVFASSASAAKTRVELFGHPAETVARPDLQFALKANGMTPIREGLGYACDRYHVGAIPAGADTLRVCYMPDESGTERLAFAIYGFPPVNGFQTVLDVEDMVAGQYGPPGSESGRRSFGSRISIWRLDGGMRITVSRSWPDKRARLMIAHSERKAAWERWVQYLEDQASKARSDKNAAAF